MKEPVYKKEFSTKCTLIIRSPEDKKREWTHGRLECESPDFENWEFKRLWSGGGNCPDAKINPIKGEIVAGVRIPNRHSPI